jgi:hypothetical protein
MAIITRPIKTGGGTDYVAGNDALAQEFNDDANVVYTDYNGNIKNVNCAADMGLVGTKLADAPFGVSTVKINDSAVTTSKIPDDAVINSKIKKTTFSHLISGTVLAGGANSITTALLSANVVPVGIELSAAGLPTNDEAKMIVGLHLNTSNDTYYLMWSNPGVVSIVVAHTAKVTFFLKA